MERYNAGNLTAEEAAAFMLGLLSRASMAELAQWHEAFMAEVIRPAIFPIAQELVQQHLAQGDLCAIVTATNEFVTAPIARAFGIPHLIGTIPEVHNGRYTGKIQGIARFPAGKVVRVNEWLKGMGAELSDFEASYFYSDSLNDLPLLDIVTHPIAANPSPVLRQLALERGWTILDLFKDMQDAKS